jgi:CheY-like chemotaxis protein
MIVDDNYFNKIILREMISKYNNKNFLFTFAQNGQEALNLFKLKNKRGEISENAIKLIFMDIEMPFMNGEVCS